MNLHPKISGTLALYQFQGNMHDSSGNGLDLSLVGGTEQYESIDTCLSGFKFNGITWMRSAVSSLIQYTGDHTIEVLLIQRQTFSQSFFKTDSHDTPFASVLWNYYIDSANRYAFTNQDTGGVRFGSPGTTISCLPYAAGTTGNHTVYHFAFRKTQTGVSQYLVECLINGVLAATPTIVTGTLSTSGNECIWVGGVDFSSFDNVFEGVMASVRMVNYARTDAQILADALYTKGTCGTVASPPVSDGAITAAPYAASVALAADTGRIYRYAPDRMPQLKGNR